MAVKTSKTKPRTTHPTKTAPPIDTTPQIDHENYPKEGLPSWLLSGLISVIFVGIGGSKILFPELMGPLFEHWGYSTQFLPFVGWVEVIGGSLFLIPRTAVYGTLILSGTMLGAILTHLNNNEYAMAAMPAVLFLAIMTIGYQHCKRIIQDDPWFEKYI